MSYEETQPLPASYEGHDQSLDYEQENVWGKLCPVNYSSLSDHLVFTIEKDSYIIGRGSADGRLVDFEVPHSAVVSAQVS
jgi:hypothetical protein